MHVTYSGINQHNLLDNGTLLGRHEVREFVGSCVNAGWARVVVSESLTHPLAGFVNGRVWFSAAVPS